ncbi:MAG: GNAT family N-acetyltransferase [Desulfuromonadales bacterium]|nr:GNAT family N-acetyltransferase [Desulfuromonadales bacterium]
MNILPLPEQRQEELFELLRLSLGEHQTRKRDRAFWNWKHAQNPFGESISYVAMEGERLVGLRTFLRWQWCAGNQSYDAIRAVDTATHPQHQRKGIFSRLTLAVLDEARREQFDFVFNTPNRKSLPGYLKMGWRLVGQLPLYVKVLAPVRFAAGLARNALTACDAEIAVEEIIAGRLVRFGDWLAAHGEELEGLLTADRLLRGPGFNTARSVEFLRWRYAGHPYVDYHVLEARAAGELRGLLICRANARRGLREVVLADLLLGSADFELVRSMIATLRRQVRADYLIAHFGSGTAQLAGLRRCGFHRLPRQGIDLTVRDLDKSVEPDPFSLDDWSLCLGDLEIF